MKKLLYFFAFSLSTLAVAQSSDVNLLRSDYWQQEVDYTIRVSLDDEQHVLRGYEELVYSNNSPDTLSFIVFHLWPNAYASKQSALAKQLLRNGNTSLAFATPEEMGGIDSLAFTLDGLPCVMRYDEEHLDICTLDLERPLLPGKSVKVATPFKVKLPTGRISRLGHLGQSYQITQWYPKPAVYDHKGWHGMPYLNQGEFYSEFGSYDVSITLPQNYTVGATGDLQNEEELNRLDSIRTYTKRYLKKSDDGITLGGSKNDDINAFPASDAAIKTLRYVQDKVHDFAWFADKRFLVSTEKMALPGRTDSIQLWAMFTPRNASSWKRSTEYLRDAVYYYSKWNGNYPYNQVTAIDGTISAGGGMEYPNVTVIGNAQTPFLLETVIMHEVGHNWFYGILGSNERDHPWLDEGINSYNELRYLKTKYPDAYMFVGQSDSPLLDRLGLKPYGPAGSQYLTYLLSSRANQDQSHSVSSQDYASLNYGAIVYAKSAVVFDYLRAYLGDEEMDRIMQAYFETYKFKHPYPEDFRSLVETLSDEDLGWLFDELLGTTEKLDIKLAKVQVGEDGETQVTLKNKGGVSGPVALSWFDEEGKETGSAWINGFDRDTSITLNAQPDRVEVDADWVMPEIDRKNNYWQANRMFNRFEPLDAALIPSLEDPRKTQFYYLPVVGANYPSGIMPGFALYNSILPVKRWNYLIAPMFSTKALTLAGTGDLYYMFTPVASSFESIDLGVRAKRFVSEFRFSEPSIAYNRIQPYLRFDFRPPNPSGFFDHEMELSAVLTQLDTLTIADRNSAVEQFYRLNYRANYDHPVYRTRLDWQNEMHEQYLRTSVTLTQTIDISEKIIVRNRLFAGYFITNATNDARFNWRMDGQYGRTDYAYDHTLLDRSTTDGLLGRQMTHTHGAFKLPTAVGQSAVGLIALNVEVQPRKLPIGVFADVGSNDLSAQLFDAGLFLSFGKGLFSVYAPLVWSNNIEQERLANGRETIDYIRFQINFDQINLVELRRNLDI